MPNITIRGIGEVSFEDGKAAGIIRLGDGIGDVVTGTNCDPEPVYVRIQSWDELRKHSALKSMEGKELVVRIEWED